MKVEVKKAVISVINIKDTFKLNIEIEDISPPDLAELVRYRNEKVKLVISDDQTQLPAEEEE